jgi:hypothetical protein
MTPPDGTSDPETIRAQMQHSYETLRAGVALAIQLCGFLAAANVVLLGYGLTQRHAGFLLLGSLMPLLMALAGWQIIVHAIPVVYVAIKAERTLAPNASTLYSTYLAIKGPDFLRRINELIASEENMEQSIKLRRLASLRASGVHRSVIAAAVGFGAVSQLGLFVVALTVFDFKFL